jgi:hypothetical protein
LKFLHKRAVIMIGTSNPPLGPRRDEAAREQRVSYI